MARSHAFWRYFFPAAQATFPDALGDVSLDDFHFAVNDVRPSLVRVEADEATYNLHILVRFELERALLDDDLSTADLPAAWNDKYEQYLGIRPATDSEGVLQDIHWSAGLVGYFPTYSLGNLYAAQFFAQAEADVGPLRRSLRGASSSPCWAGCARRSTCRASAIRRPSSWSELRGNRCRTPRWWPICGPNLPRCMA